MKTSLTLGLLALLTVLSTSHAQMTPPQPISEQLLNSTSFTVHKLTLDEIETGLQEERLAHATLMRDKQSLLSLVKIPLDQVQNFRGFSGGWGSGQTFYYRVVASLKDGGHCDLGIGIHRPSQKLESRSVMCKDSSGKPVADKSMRLMPREY
jgi:hypothetical protein